MGCIEKACAFPVVQDGLCAFHLRDRDTASRPFGVDLGQAPPISLPPPEVTPIKNWKIFDPKAQKLVSNTLDPQVRQAVIDGLMAGMSTRKVCDKTGVAQLTAGRIRKEIADKLPKLCSCGRQNGHRGWCKGRLAESPARQVVMEQLHGNGRKSGLRSKFLGEIKDMRETLIKERGLLDEKIKACDDVIELAGKLWD